jgi:CRP-like cAMP-binding protein
MAPIDVLLNKLAQHSPLESDDIKKIRHLPCSTQVLSSGQDFVRQGDFPRASAIVVEGLVARYHTLESGGRQYLSYHLPGDWPDAQALFLERMDHSVCAVGRAVVCAVPHNELIELFCERPTIAFAVWRQTLIDASIFREAITNNSSRDALTRLAHLFCELYFRAKQAGLVKANIYNLPLTQAQIGETLGMSLVSVNRNLQRLRKHAPADFKAGKLIVRDWEKLAALGEFDPQYLHQQLRAKK